MIVWASSDVEKVSASPGEAPEAVVRPVSSSPLMATARHGRDSDNLRRRPDVRFVGESADPLYARQAIVGGVRAGVETMECSTYHGAQPVGGDHRFVGMIIRRVEGARRVFG